MAYKIKSRRDSRVSIDFFRNSIFCHHFVKNYTKVNAYNFALMSELAYSKKRPVQNAFGTLDSSAPGNMPRLRIREAFSPFTLPAPGSAEEFQYLEKSRLVRFHSNAATDTQCFFYRSGSSRCMAVRGTQEPMDALIDTVAREVDFPEGAGRLHLGFYLAFLSIKEEIDSFFSDVGSGNAMLTGHSLGGAVATIAAAYIRSHYTPNVMLYTYGSPRAGDREFAGHYTDKEPIIHYRCVHGRDIVPQVPWPGLDLRFELIPLLFKGHAASWKQIFKDRDGNPYTHQGKLVYLNRYSKGGISVHIDRKAPLYFNIPEMEILKSLIKIDLNAFKKIFIRFGDDHRIVNYVPILAADLKMAVSSWLDIDRGTPKPLDKAIQELNSELREMENLKHMLDSKMFSLLGSVISDTTRKIDTSWDISQYPDDKKNELAVAIMHKKIELRYLKQQRDNYCNPAYKKKLLKSIIGHTAVTDEIRREFRYQAEQLKYG